MELWEGEESHAEVLGVYLLEDLLAQEQLVVARLRLNLRKTLGSSIGLSTPPNNRALRPLYLLLRQLLLHRHRRPITIQLNAIALNVVLLQLAALLLLRAHRVSSALAGRVD